MQITFQTKARKKGFEAKARGQKFRGKGRLTVNLANYKTIPFENGFYTTTDKNEISLLLHNRLYQDGTIELTTPIEIVEKYLRGDEPDRLSQDILKRVDDEGLVKIAKIEGIPQSRHKNYPNIIRTMLRGRQIIDSIKEVLDEHSTKAPEETMLEQATEQELIYRNGPWYKYRLKDQKDKENDLTIGKTEEEVQEFITENKSELKDRLTDDNE